MLGCIYSWACIWTSQIIKNWRHTYFFFCSFSVFSTTSFMKYDDVCSCGSIAPNLQIIIHAFQVATNVKGRGVLRLLLLQQQLRLLSIPALLLQLFMLAFPSWLLHFLLCISFDVVTLIVDAHQLISSITIATGRYFYGSPDIQ